MPHLADVRAPRDYSTRATLVIAFPSLCDSEACRAWVSPAVPPPACRLGGPPCQAISSGVRLQARPMDPAPLASSRHIGEFRHDRARPFLHVIAEMRTRRCSSPCGNPTIRDGRSSRTYAPHVAHARTGLRVRVNALPSSNRSDMPPPLSRYMDDRKAPSPVFPSSRN